MRRANQYSITFHIIGCLPLSENPILVETRKGLREWLREFRKEQYAVPHIDLITPVQDILKLRPGEFAVYMQFWNLEVLDIERVR